MKKSSFWWAAFVCFILTASYLYSIPAEPIRLEYGVWEMNTSSNIIHFSHNSYVGEDPIFLAYTVGKETYSVPDENGKYFNIKFVRKTQEEIDRVVNSTGYDGYFIEDEVDDTSGRRFKITGVVKGNVCHYLLEKIVFEKLPYRTVWDYD